MDQNIDLWQCVPEHFRDPVDQFESMYNYVHFEEKFSMGLEEFVDKYVRPRLPVRRVNGYLGRNQQFWDLGYAAGGNTTKYT